MKILWIPHASWLNKIRQRSHYFIDRLKKKHEIHILVWTEPKGPKFRYFLNPSIHWKALQNWTKRENQIHLHHFRRLCLSRYNLLRKVNEKFFQHRVKEIVKKYRIDIIFCGSNYYLNGFPPFDLGIPVIFDYADYIGNQKTKEVYLKESEAVICASNVLHNDAQKYNKNCFYVPNGIDLHKFKKTNPERIRRKYRLDKEKIISLIGITCSESFYFLDSVQFIREAVSQVKFMVVGDSYLIPEMKKHVEKYRDDVIFTGWVDYNEIPDYFAASDVGTYPVEKNVYFDSACPIKVLEYTAAKKPVVSIELEELKLLGFKNIVFSEPNARDFAKNVIKAMNKTFNYPSLSEFDWEKLSQRVENIIYGQLPVK